MPAGAMLTVGARLWTYDERLAAVVDQLELGVDNGPEP